MLFTSGLLAVGTAGFVGCGNSTVTLEPEAGGLLPPPNPTVDLPEEQPPQVTLSGVKPWLDTQTLPIEAWYSLYANGRCIGFSQITVAASETQGASLLRLTKRDILEIPATADQPIERREIVLESLERPNGDFLRFTETTKSAAKVTEAAAELLRETLSATRVVDGKSQAVSLAWPKGAWGPLGIVEIFRQSQMKPDEVHVAQVFFPPLSKFAKVEFKSGSKVWTTLSSSDPAELLPVETTMEIDGQKAVTKNWVNDSGEIMKSISQDGLTMFRTTQADTERIDGEIQSAQLVASKIAVGADAEQLNATQVVFTVDSENIDPFTILSSKVNQRTKSLSAQGAELTVTRATPTEPVDELYTQDAPTPDYSRPIEADSPQLSKFLAEHPADESGSASDSALDTATVLTKAVHRSLKKSENSRQFFTATETLQNEAGDCKAHSILLLAALRQRNIPARAASGLRIVKAGEDIVAIYHMWCEAWIGDRWMPLDPFVGSVGVGVDHIKFLEASLNEPDRHTAMLPVLRSMNQLTIAVKE